MLSVWLLEAIVQQEGPSVEEDDEGGIHRMEVILGHGLWARCG